MNDSGDHEDQNRCWDGTLLYSSHQLAIAIYNDPLAIPSSISGVVHSDLNDRNDFMETRLKNYVVEALQHL